MDIDFVLMWVDGNDPEWQKKKAFYEGKNYDEKAAAYRYRDWDILHYWFRAIEKNAPWVRKIHVVTDGQIPPFLNLEHPKINFVKHSDFMPERYLPTFSARAIEVNLHRIPGIAEQFVFFNDDMFMNREMKESHFFQNGKPCYMFADRPFKDSFLTSAYQYARHNGMMVINKYFSKKDLLRKGITKVFNPRYGKRNINTLKYFFRSKEFTSFVDDHIPFPYLKSTYEEVWEKENDILETTSMHKFRSNDSVNQYVFKYWDTARGNFIPWRTDGVRYDVQLSNLDSCVKDIEEGHNKLICVNDSQLCDDFDTCKERIIQAFETRYPNKSAFEK